MPWCKKLRRPRCVYIQTDPDLFIGERIPIFNEFPSDDIWNPTPADDRSHFILRQKDWRNGRFANKRLAIQEVVMMLMERGWIEPRYAEQKLVWDLQRLRKERTDKYWRSGGRVRPFAAHCLAPGHAILAHFLDIGGCRVSQNLFTNHPILMRDLFDDPRYLHCVIDSLLRGRRNVTLHSVIERGGQAIRPGLYRAMFRDVLCVERPIVLDMTPEWGDRAVAVGAEGGIYIYADDGGTFPAGAQEMAEFLGIEMEPDDGQTADLALIGGIRMLSADAAMPLMEEVEGRADKTLVFLSGGEEKAFLDKYPTDQRIQFETMSTSPDGWVLVYR